LSECQSLEAISVGRSSSDTACSCDCLGWITNSMKDAFVDGYDDVVVAAVKRKYGVSLWVLGGRGAGHSLSIAKTTIPLISPFAPKQ
jgi:hypothetical protein